MFFATTGPAGPAASLNRPGTGTSGHLALLGLFALLPAGLLLGRWHRARRRDRRAAEPHSAHPSHMQPDPGNQTHELLPLP